MIARFTALLLLILCAVAPAAAQELCTYTPYSGSGAQDWTNATRWTCGHVPTAADIAILPDLSAVEAVALNVDATVAGLRMEGVHLGGSGTLTVTGHMRWTDGNMRGTGTTIVAPGATLEIVADANFLGLTDTRRFIHEGTGTWRGTQDISISTDARFENRGVIELTASREEGPTRGVVFGSGRFVNAPGGVIRRSGPGASTMYGPFDNDGLVEVLEGEFRLRDFNGSGGTATGTYTLAEGTRFVFDGNHTFTETASLGGPGLVRTGANSSGAVHFNGTLDVPALELLSPMRVNLNTDAEVETLRLESASGGSLGGSGTLTVTGAMTWTGGHLRGSGTTVIAEGATLAIAPSAGTTGFGDTRRLINEGTATWSSNDDRYLSNQTANVFENRGTVTVTATNEGAFADFFGGHFINAEGAVFRREGPGVTRFSSLFDNHGTVDVAEGELRLQGFNGPGGTDTGTYLVAEGARLAFLDARALTEGAVVAGRGTVAQGTNALTNRAAVSPGGLNGATAGALVWEAGANNRPFAPLAEAALAFRLAGTEPVVDHEQLQVVGTAALGGTLRIELGYDYRPAVGERFTLVTCTEACAGTFDAVEAPAGYQFAVDVQAQAVEVEVTAAPDPGCGFTVTTAADAGMGSLRDAIAEANADADPTTICFAIPGDGPHAIALASALPNVETPVVIDGYSQPGASPNTRDVGHDATILVELDAEGADTGFGLYLTGPGASGSVVRGLAVVNAAQAGVMVTSPPTQAPLADVRIEGNVVGLRANGEAAGNERGVWITANTTGTVVGGAEAAARNVLSGNARAGVECGAISSLAIADAVRIENNYVGTDRSGVVARGNGREGLRLENCRAEVVGNVVAGNAREGIYASAGASLAAPVAIRGNLVGVGADGEAALGNGPGPTNTAPGIELAGGALLAGSVIGGTEPGDGNTIAHHARDGVRIRHIDANDPTVGVAVLGNRIFANGEGASHLGIDLDPDGATANDPGDADAGPNNLQNHPDVTAAEVDGAGDLLVTYRVDSDPQHAAYPLRVELFLADGHSQGAAFLGADAYAEADWSGCGAAPCEKTVNLGPAADLGVEAGMPLVATATDDEGNTSEFAARTHAVPAERAAELPAALVLHAPYPNPAAGPLTMTFDLPASGHVRLAVYDVLGREVAVLADGEQPAGRHTAHFDAAHLPSGLYLVQMTAGGFKQTQRLTVLR